MNHIISNQQFDEERALYHLTDTRVEHCRFEGPADGESALKECRSIHVMDCQFHLRYPFWHDRVLEIRGCELTPQCRAALWYSSDVAITDTKLHGIKALRECEDMKLARCQITSPEFGWKCKAVTLTDSSVEAEYLFFDSRDVQLNRVEMKGKYSFQYVENLHIEGGTFDTKDAFWHAENVTVYDSIVKGEYLGWYSKNLRLVRCEISGTQPLCYCKGLVLEDCEMIDTDLSFERTKAPAAVAVHCAEGDR